MRIYWVGVFFLLLTACGSEQKGSSAGETADNGATSGSVDGDSAAHDLGANEDAEQVPDVVEATDVEEEPQDVVDIADQSAPEDSGSESDMGKVTPKDVKEKVDLGPQCEQLGLAEQWEGTFDGKITTNLGDTNVDGTMAFEIGCFAGKLYVKGEMNGLGEGQPFVVTLQGSYNPADQTINCKLIDGTVQLFFFLPIAFEGVLTGTYDGTEFVGDWNGENTDKTLLDASGIGTWKAHPQ